MLGSAGLGGDEVPCVGVDVVEVGVVVVVPVGVVRRHLLDAGGNAPQWLDVRLRGCPATRPSPSALPSPRDSCALPCLSPGVYAALPPLAFGFLPGPLSFPPRPRRGSRPPSSAPLPAPPVPVSCPCPCPCPWLRPQSSTASRSAPCAPWPAALAPCSRPCGSFPCPCPFPALCPASCCLLPVLCPSPLPLASAPCPRLRPRSLPCAPRPAPCACPWTLPLSPPVSCSALWWPAPCSLLGVGGGRPGLPGRRPDRRSCLCQPPLLAHREGLPRVPRKDRGDWGAGKKAAALAVILMGGAIGVRHHWYPGRHAWRQACLLHYLLVHLWCVVGSTVQCSAGGRGGGGGGGAAVALAPRRQGLVVIHRYRGGRWVSHAAHTSRHSSQSGAGVRALGPRDRRVAPRGAAPGGLP